MKEHDALREMLEDILGCVLPPSPMTEAELDATRGLCSIAGQARRATDRLDLKHAKQICAYIAGPTVAGKLTDMYKTIRDYIDILEGKDR